MDIIEERYYDKIAALEAKKACLEKRIERYKEDAENRSSALAALEAKKEYYHTEHAIELNRRVELEKQVVTLEAELKEQLEQGISIMHDQGAENILLKEQIAALQVETKRLYAETVRLGEQVAALTAERNRMKEALERVMICSEAIDCHIEADSALKQTEGGE